MKYLLFPNFKTLINITANLWTTMEKLEVSQILVSGAELSAEKLNEKNQTVTKLIDETKQKQAEILKLKEVDQERLRMVVQL